MCKLCYLSDLFEKLNELNVSLQGENTNIFLLKNKIQAFIIKLAMWLQKCANDSFEMFSYTQDFIVEKKFNVDFIKSIITDHLAYLKNNFQKYFVLELDNNEMDWITNPCGAWPHVASTPCLCASHLSTHSPAFQV